MPFVLLIVGVACSTEHLLGKPVVELPVGTLTLFALGAFGRSILSWGVVGKGGLQGVLGSFSVPGVRRRQVASRSFRVFTIFRELLLRTSTVSFSTALITSR